ncbi:MAG: transglutaminase domain-containing protein [Bacteroidales bacterium]|nr:transglutaminase domain-containing protein [Bacteroidales bacterium]
MKVKYFFLVIGMLIAGCTTKDYYQADVKNPAYRPNLVFRSGEDLTSPKFAHLISKYQLDTIFHGETDEFKRILLLRHWIKSVIRIDDHGEPYPGDNFAEGILDGALKGHGFHCGHYMVVQNAVLNAYGYVTRTLGAGPGVKGGPDGHHGIDEVWSNQYNKWFLSDAKYDHHFEKNGIPLSALEIRDEFLKNNCADIIKVKGPDRVPFDIDAETGLSKVQNAQTYTWIEWHCYNDLFTVFPDYKELLIMYNDDYFKSHTWIWDNKPHWAFSHPESLKLVNDRDSIYWTPNTISSTVGITDGIASIKLTSATPNLKEYQMKQLPSGTWMKTDKDQEIKLKGEKMEFVFRTVNLAGVTGPEHNIIIARK